jgi:DnaJ-class molecular chaperone
MKLSFTNETKSCTRCGGSGQYSYCAMWGSRCFKCHGTGKVLTTRCAKRRAEYTALRAELLGAAAETIQIGDVVELQGRFRRITDVARQERAFGSSINNGPMVYSDGITLMYDVIINGAQTQTGASMPAGTVVVKRATVEQLGILRDALVKMIGKGIVSVTVDGVEVAAPVARRAQKAVAA